MYRIKTSYLNSGFICDWCWINFGNPDPSENPEHHWKVSSRLYVNTPEINGLVKIWEFSNKEDFTLFQLVWGNEYE